MAKRGGRLHLPRPFPSPPAPHLLADGGHVILILAEAIDAAEGDGFDVVAEEEAVVTAGPPRGLGQHHQQQRLQAVGVGRQRVPVRALQLWGERPSR